MKSPTQDTIMALLGDGKPRSANEIAIALGIDWKNASLAVQKMTRNGKIIAAAGYSHVPPNGHTSRRYVVNAEVTA